MDVIHVDFKTGLRLDEQPRDTAAPQDGPAPSRRRNLVRHGVPVLAATTVLAAAGVAAIFDRPDAPERGCGVGIVREGDGALAVVDQAAADAHDGALGHGVHNRLAAATRVAELAGGWDGLRPGHRYEITFTGPDAVVGGIHEVYINHCAGASPAASFTHLASVGAQ